jgi:hypothetical protein
MNPAATGNRNNRADEIKFDFKRLIVKNRYIWQLKIKRKLILLINY